MALILRRPAAEDDLVAIWVYIAADDPASADRLLDKFDETFLLIAGNPHIGRARPELGSNLRSFTVGRYVAFYVPIEGGIEIMRVLHGARDIEDSYSI